MVQKLTEWAKHSPVVRRGHNFLVSIGLNPSVTISQISGLRWFRSSLAEYESQRRNSLDGLRFPATGKRYRIVSDRFDNAGTASGHYFHQDLWVARKIFENNPRKHVDFGSRVDGFVAHVASFRDIQVGDIRPLASAHPSILTFEVDLSKPELIRESIADSISCLHALEHFGLGRYGDPVDYDGWKKGFESLTKALEPGGTLYLSVPISGEERVEFNAHRIFSVTTIQSLIAPHFVVVDFAYVDDRGDLILYADVTSAEYLESFRLEHGCGIWILRKTSSQQSS